MHHIIHLTPDNINNPEVTVNPNNLISLCGECHKAIHKRDKVAGIKKRVNTKSFLPEVIFDDNGYPIPVTKSPRGSA